VQRKAFPVALGHPIGARASLLAHDFPQESLVCYTFVEWRAAGNAAHNWKVCCVSGVFVGKGCLAEGQA